MATSSILAIQTAMYGVLSADTTLMGLTAVLNDAESNQPYPYVLMSHAHERTWHTFGGADEGIGWNTIVRLHIYSQYQGDLEALTILDRLVDLLNFQTFTITGYGTAWCEYEMGRVLLETNPDKIQIRHIPAEFRWYLHQ
jgi:hypothetical protein